MSTPDAITTIRARFGLPAGDDAAVVRELALRRAAASCAAVLDRVLAPGGVAMVTGPSGAGKSLVLAALAETAAGASMARPVSRRGTRAVIELFGSSLEDRLWLLGCCGLADAQTLVTPAGGLSVGQRHRLMLALAFDRARRTRRTSTVIVDEFCSTLDRVTAQSVAACVRRLIGPSVRLVCATAHDDLIGALRPDVLVYVPLEGRAEVLTRGAA